jgi:hypothetical protein
MRYIVLNVIFVILFIIPVHLSAQMDKELYKQSDPILKYTKLHFSGESQKAINDVFPEVDFYAICDLRTGGGFPGGKIKATYRNKDFLLPNDFNLLLFSVNSTDHISELYSKNEIIKAYFYMFYQMNNRFDGLKIESFEVKSGKIEYPISDGPNIPSDFKNFDTKIIVKFTSTGRSNYWNQGEFYFKIKDQRIIVSRGYIVHSEGYQYQFRIWSEPNFGTSIKNSSSESIN